MDDRDFMDMMYQGMTKTTHAETAYWGFEPANGEDDQEGFDLFYVDQAQPDFKQRIGWLQFEQDAAFLTAVHGAFPDIHRRWLEALDVAEEKDVAKDEAEGVAADLSARLAAYEQKYGVEDWHGKVKTGA